VVLTVEKWIEYDLKNCLPLPNFGKIILRKVGKNLPQKMKETFDLALNRFFG